MSGYRSSIELRVCGLCSKIRTCDPLHPMQVRYQAALHADVKDYTEVKGQMKNGHPPRPTIVVFP